MILSFWEKQTWFSNIDFTVVGSGIVGLHCALQLRCKYPAAKILVLEKGTLPEGASTKNAGFACFGSISEIIDDLQHHSEQEVIDLVKKRKIGLELLRKNIGDQNIDFQQNGGFEVFLDNDKTFFDECIFQIPFINDLFSQVFESEVFLKNSIDFGFKNVFESQILNPFEGQIDTGKMMQSLLKKTIANNILILNNQEVLDFCDNNKQVEISLKNFSFKTNKLFFATNGFAAKLTNNAVKPARAQVLITSEIEKLDWKGTFHLDKGYVYFRNIGNRVLLGGGRNLDFATETTTEITITTFIQNHLENLLKTVILPQHSFVIEHRWAGIMGMGESKSPIVEQLTDNVFCGVRLGGMGVAIGSLVGTELADLCTSF
jgi:glycine/D-amino acid oxidase-like deaminating enzyme